MRVCLCVCASVHERESVQDALMPDGINFDPTIHNESPQFSGREILFSATCHIPTRFRSGL